MILKEKYSKDDLADFARYIIELQDKVGFRVSSRGWAYILEQERLINKDQFDRVTGLINRCRKEGHLPIDLVAEESVRQFQGVEIPARESVIEDFGSWLETALEAADLYALDWWAGEEYYVQCVVEKVDLVTLFRPICRKYHIPIANSKGWGSMLQRAEYARRFKKAEDKGLKCVLLYCGDHDPDGLRISDFIRSNLVDLQRVTWEDGEEGYDPSNLIVDRFGLNYDFIVEHNLTWIDNLITGGKKSLDDPTHKNHYMPYVQSYLDQVGVRKCEANAIVVMPDAAKKLITDAIEIYLGDDALDRFKEKREDVKAEFNDFLDETGLKGSIDIAIEQIENYNK